MLVDDDDNDILLMRHAFASADLQNPPAILRDGEEAIHYLEGAGQFCDRSRHPIPCMILVDFKMPKVDGIELTQWIRRNPLFKKLIVIMISSSGLHADSGRRAFEGGEGRGHRRSSERARDRGRAQRLLSRQVWTRRA